MPYWTTIHQPLLIAVRQSSETSSDRKSIRGLSIDSGTINLSAPSFQEKILFLFFFVFFLYSLSLSHLINVYFLFHFYFFIFPEFRQELIYKISEEIGDIFAVERMTDCYAEERKRLFTFLSCWKCTRTVSFVFLGFFLIECFSIFNFKNNFFKNLQRPHRCHYSF